MLCAMIVNTFQILLISIQVLKLCVKADNDYCIDILNDKLAYCNDNVCLCKNIFLK